MADFSESDQDSSIIANGIDRNSEDVAETSSGVAEVEAGEGGAVGAMDLPTAGEVEMAGAEVEAFGREGVRALTTVAGAAGDGGVNSVGAGFAATGATGLGAGAPP